MTIYTPANPRKPYKNEKISTIYKETEMKKVAKIVDAESELAEIVDEVVVVSEVDTHKLTQSFIGQTGLEAVMKRVAITGDASLLNTITTDKDEIADACALPTSLGEVKALAKQADALEKQLPPELLKGRSVEEFLAGDIEAEIAAYIEGLKTVTKEVPPSE